MDKENNLKQTLFEDIFRRFERNDYHNIACL